MRSSKWLTLVRRSVGVLALAPFLSGCIVAAVPLVLAATAAGVAIGGFSIYKVVQTSTGGKVQVAFGSADSKSLPPPAPLPVAHKIAVWPGSTREVQFAETLSKSGRFEVSSPAAVSRVLSTSALSPDLKQLTAQEETNAYASVCRGTGAQMLFSARDEGQSTSAHMLSFKRSDITTKSALAAYDCASHTVVWRDQMAVVLLLGSNVPTDAEVEKIAGQAWAERVLSAPKKS